MKAEKLTSNLEFDVIYADGTKKHVKEGVLFEACEDGHTGLHIGTSRTEILVAFVECAIEFAREVFRSPIELVHRGKDGRK